MRTTNGLLVLLIGAVCMIGCAGKPSVVGKWNSSTQMGDMTMELKEDGTFTQTMMGGKVLANGTYKLETAGEETKLSFHVTKVTAGGNDVTKMVPAGQIDQTGTVKIEKDKFTMTQTAGGQSVSQEFTRATEAK